jgi:hypothetical protein
MTFHRVSSAIVAMVFLASGCKIQSRIQEGQKVSMDPCKVVGLDKVQAVLGVPMFQSLALGPESEGNVQFGRCFYGARSLEVSPQLNVWVDNETSDNTRQFDFLGEFKVLKGLGREARYQFVNGDDPLDTLRLVALSEKGARLTLFLITVDAEEQSLLAKARSMAVPALARMEKTFPGTEKPPPSDEPPTPICSAIGTEAMIQIYKPFWSPPAGKSIVLTEAEFFGGPESIGGGPVGGGWVCHADIDSGEEVYHPHTGWSISKASPPPDPIPGSQRVRGLGASAFSWVDDSGWHFGEKSLMLSVFSKSGKYIEVEVSLDGTKESAAKSVATRVAELIIAKLP